MGKFTKSALAASVLAATTLGSSAAMAGVSGNVGVTSDYFFRGIDQGSGATASAGIDYSHDSGAYAGTWLADVGTGIEYDLYAGYATEISGVSLDVGYFTYNYTSVSDNSNPGGFDNTYAEVSISAGYGPVSVQYAFGTHADTSDADSNDDDYTFLGLTYEYASLYGTYGVHGGDFEGNYIELGYNTMMGDWDATVSLISNSEELSNVDVDGDGNNDSEMSLVFSTGTSFDL